jgi:hydrogenase maturation protein HypF
MLLRELGFEIVATSGNLSDEPICIDELEALERLRGIADGFLIHDRPIVRHVDDSVVRVMRGREMMLRRARGYAPLPIRLRDELPCILAVGAEEQRCPERRQESSSISTSESRPARHCKLSMSPDLLPLETTPAVVVCDFIEYLLLSMHQLTAPVCRFRIMGTCLSCMAENEIDRPHWGFHGMGRDTGRTTIWGGNSCVLGEIPLNGSPLSTLPSPGRAAIRQPSRTASAFCFETWGDAWERFVCRRS